MREKIIERLQGDKWGYRIGYLVDEILDMPVDGVQVKIECPCEELSAREHCQCTLKRSLTIGEALEMLPNMVYLLSEKVNDPLYRDALTAKDGGIVEVKG